MQNHLILKSDVGEMRLDEKLDSHLWLHWSEYHESGSECFHNHHFFTGNNLKQAWTKGLSGILFGKNRIEG